MRALIYLTARYRVELKVVDELYVLRLYGEMMPPGWRAFYEARGRSAGSGGRQEQLGRASVQLGPPFSPVAQAGRSLVGSSRPWESGGNQKSTRRVTNG